VQAYWHWRDGMSLREIAAEMAGPPHHCGSWSTAKGWIERGREIESVSGGPLSKRNAQRERVAAAYDQLRLKIEHEMKTGLIDRVHGRRLQADLLTRYAQLLGLPKPARAKVNVNGETTIGVDPDVLRVPVRPLAR
jgi:transposase